MASIMGGIFGGNNGGMNDKVIANDMMAGGKSLASSYFNAQLESVTPEIRMIFGQYAAQKAQEHEALTKIAIEKGWYSAYGSPAQQLRSVFDQSGDIVDKDNRE